MPRIKMSESFPERAISVLIVGTPFSYKTSLALTAKDVLLIDAEKGSERAHGRAKETFRLGDKGWQEYRDEVAIGMLDEFQTVVVDTGGAWVDDIYWDFALKVKFTANSQKNWGTVKEEFKKDYGRIRSANKDLIVVSHEKSTKDDDTTIYDLDMSGSAKNILLRGADMVGFIYKKSIKDGNKVVTKTMITFNPTSSTPFCKNVAQVPDMELPDRYSEEWKGFLDRMIIQPTKKRISEMSDDQLKAIEVVATYREAIDEVNMSDADLKALNASWKDEPEHIRLQLRSYFGAHLKAKGWKYYADKTEFAPIAAVDPAPVVETPPVEAEKQPAPVATGDDLFEPTAGE